MKPVLRQLPSRGQDKAKWKDRRLLDLSGSQVCLCSWLVVVHTRFPQDQVNVSVFFCHYSKGTRYLQLLDLHTVSF